MCTIQSACDEMMEEGCPKCGADLHADGSFQFVCDNGHIVDLVED